MNKEVPKCKCCSRRRKSSDDIPSEVIYLYCKPCCKPGTIHKTKCCEKCSIFDTVPMCRCPSSDIDLKSAGNPINIEVLPGYDEPSNKIDKMLRELFNCEEDTKSDEEILSNLIEDTKGASVEPCPANFQPVINDNEDRTSWMKKLMKGEMSKAFEQATDVGKSKDLNENIKSHKSERSKNSFDMYTKSESWNRSEYFSMSSADSTKIRAFIDLQPPENYEEFKPLKIPEEWKKPIETNESIIWKTAKDSSIEREASNLINARQGKAKETKSTPKPAEFRKSGDSESTKSQIPAKVRKVGEQVKPTERKSDEIKSSSTRNSRISRKSEDLRKSGDIQKSRNETKLSGRQPNFTPKNSNHSTETKRLMSARSIAFSTSSEEAVQTPRISERKKYKERKISGCSVVPEIKPNEENPKSGEFRNFPYSTIAQNKSDNVKDRVEEFRNFGNLENLSSSKNFKEARTTQEIEKFENLKILSNEWYKPQKSDVPTDIKKSPGDMDKEQKKFEEMQKIIELISFLSKTSENESEDEGSSKGLQDKLTQFKQTDHLQMNTEFKTTDDQISNGKTTQAEVLPESYGKNFTCITKSTETIKSAELEMPVGGEQPKYWDALAKVINSIEKLPGEVEDIKKHELPLISSAHKLDGELTITDEIQSKMVGEIKRTQDKREQTTEVETKYENLPESENFWNFVRLRPLEEGENSQHLTDTEELIEERKFDELQNFENASSAKARKTSTNDKQLKEIAELSDLKPAEDLTKIQSSDMLYSATWSDVSQIAELKESESFEMVEHIKNSEMEPARTLSKMIQLAELRKSESLEMLEQIKNSERGPARTWSDVSQLEDLRKSESLETLKQIKYSEMEQPRTWSDVSQLEELRKSESIEILEQIKNSEREPTRTWSDVSQLEELRKSESLEMLKQITTREIEPARTLSKMNQLAELRESENLEMLEQVKKSELEPARIWSDVSQYEEPKKYENLEVLEKIKNSEVKPAGIWSDVNQHEDLRKYENLVVLEKIKNSEVGPARIWSDVSQLEEPKKYENLEILDQIKNSELEPATIWSDVSQFEEPKKYENLETLDQIKNSELEPARIWSDVSQLEELRKSENLEMQIETNEIEPARTLLKMNQLAELSKSENLEKLEQVKNSELEPARIWSDVSQFEEPKKYENLEVLEKIKNSEVKPAGIWSDVNQHEDLRKYENLEVLEKIKNSEVGPARIWSDVSQLEEPKKYENLETLDQIKNSELEPARIWSDVSQFEEPKKYENLETFDQIKNSELEPARIWSDVSQLEELRQAENLEMQIETNEIEPARTLLKMNQLAELSKSENLEKLEQVKNSELEPARIWSDVSQFEELRKYENLETLEQIKNNEVEPARFWSNMSQLADDRSKQEEIKKSEGLTCEDKVEKEVLPINRELSNLNRIAITEQARTAQELGIPVVCENSRCRKVKPDNVENKCICCNSSEHPRSLEELRKFEYRTNPNWRKPRKLKMFDEAFRNLKDQFKGLKRQRETATTELTTTATEVTQSCECEDVERWERYRYVNGRFVICSKDPSKSTKLKNTVDIGTSVKYRKYGTCRVSGKTYKEIKKTEKIKIAKKVWNVIHLTRSEDKSSQEDRKSTSRLRKMPKYIPATCSNDTRISSFDSIKLQDWAKPKKRGTSKRTRDISKSEQLRKPEGFEKLEVKETPIGMSKPEQLRKLNRLETPERLKETEILASAELPRPDLLQPANLIMPGGNRLWTDVSQNEELMEPEDYYKHALRESGIHMSIDIQSSDLRDSDVSSNLKTKLSWTDISQFEEITGSNDLETLEYLKEKEKFVTAEMQANVSRLSLNSSMAEAKRSDQSEEVRKLKDLKIPGNLRESERSISAEKRSSEKPLSDIKKKFDLQKTVHYSSNSEVRTSQAEELKEQVRLNAPEGSKNYEYQENSEIREPKDMGTPPFWVSANSSNIGQSVEPRAPSADYNIYTIKKSHEETESEMNQSTGLKVADLWKVLSRSEIYRFTDDQSTDQMRALEDLNISKDMKTSDDGFEGERSELAQTQATHSGDISHTAGSEIMKTSLEMSQLEEFRNARNVQMSQSMRPAGRSAASKMQTDLSKLLSNSDAKTISVGKRKRSENELTKSLKRISQSKRLQNQLYSKSLSEQMYSGETEKSAIWGNPKAWRKVRKIELYGKVQSSKDEIEQEIENLTKSPINLEEQRIPEEQRLEDWSKEREIYGSAESEYKTETEDVPLLPELSNSNHFAITEQARTAQALEIPVVCEQSGWKQVEPWETSEEVETWLKYQDGKARSVISSKERRKSTKLKNTVAIGKSLKYRKCGTWRVSSKTHKEMETVEKIKIAKKIWNIIYLAGSDEKSDEEDQKSISKSHKIATFMPASCSTDTRISSFDSIKHQDWRKRKEWRAAVKRTTEIGKSEQLRAPEHLETPDRFNETEMLASAGLKKPNLMQPVYLIMAEAKRIWSDVSQNEELRDPESIEMLEQKKNSEREPATIWSDVSQLEELRKSESLELLKQIKNNEMEPARTLSKMSQPAEQKKSENLEMLEQIKNSEVEPATIWSDVSQLEELRKSESLEILDQIKKNEVEPARIWSDVSQLEELRKYENLEALEKIKNSEVEPARILSDVSQLEERRKAESLETPDHFTETETLASAGLQTPNLMQPVYLIMAESKQIWTDVSQNDELMEPEDYDIRELRASGIHRTSTSQPEELKGQLSLKAPQVSENNEIKINSEMRESKDWGTPCSSASLQVKRISSAISQSVKPRSPSPDFNIYKEINVSTDINKSTDFSEEHKCKTWSKRAEIQGCSGWKSECKCNDVKRWVRNQDDEGCSNCCSKELRKSTKLKNTRDIGTSVKYRKYGTWRVSSKAWKEIEKAEKIKLAKMIWNVVHLTHSEDKSNEENCKSISKLRKTSKYIPASCSTDTRTSSFVSIKLQDWKKPKKCETHEKKINKGANKSAKLPKNGKVCYYFRSTTSDEKTTSIEKLTGILEKRRRANLKSNTSAEEPQGGRDEEACSCLLISEDLENPTGARKSAGKEVFSVLGDNRSLTMSDEIKNIDCGSDKELPEAQANLKSGELLYYFRAPSSEDARNSIIKKLRGTENPLVDNQSGQQIKCVTLANCNNLGTLKYWAIPRHLNVPGNLATIDSFDLGRLEKLGKSNDFEKLDDEPIILKGSPHQEKSNGSVVMDIVREAAICERTCEEVKNEEKTVEVNGVQCVNNVTNAQMCQAMILKNEEICDQQDLTKQDNYFNFELMTTDSQDSIGCQTSEVQLGVDELSKQSLTKEHELDTTAQMDKDEKIMLIERMSGGGEINDDTEEEEEEEVQEEIYDENLCKKKFRKRANCTETTGSSAGCNLSERNNLTEQPNLEARAMRSDRSNSSNLRSSRVSSSNHGHGSSRNDTRLYAGENLRMRQSYSQRGRRDVDDEDVGLVEKVQNVTRRITSSGNVVEVCETVRYAKVFKNSYEDLNPRMEFSNFNPHNMKCDSCTMPCNCSSFRNTQSSNYSNSCCCRHSDQCSDTDPCCCDCDRSSNSDCDAGQAVLSISPSIGYLKHDENIVTDKCGMNKPKNFNSEENLNIENTAQEIYHETVETSQLSSDSLKSSNPCCCNCHRSNSDFDGACAVLRKTPTLGYDKPVEVDVEVEDSETKQSKDDENDAVELSNEKAKSTSLQVAGKGNSIENSGSVVEPSFFNGNNRVLHPNKKFQSKMKRYCTSGQPWATERGCQFLRLGPLIGSRGTQNMPDAMGIMMPTRRNPSVNELQSKQIEPINLRAGAELDSESTHIGFAELNAVLANKRNHNGGNNGREIYNRNQITDSRRVEPTRKLNSISEMENLPTNHRHTGVSNNNQIFYNKSETFAADQRNNFEPHIEPQTYNHHYSSFSDRDAKYHQRRLAIDRRRKDLARLYSNEHNFSNEQINHFKRKPDAVVNILVDSKGRGQVFGPDVKSVNYHDATSTSIISISTNRKKNLNSVDERIHYNRGRQARRSRSYEAFQQPSSARYEEIDELQMRNRRLGGGADRTDFEEREFCGYDNGKICCCKPCSDVNMESAPENSARNLNQRTYSSQQFNEPETGYYSEENYEMRKREYFSSGMEESVMDVVGGGKRKNIGDRRNYYENGEEFQQYRNGEGSDQSISDAETLPEEFVVSQTDLRQALNNNEDGFYVDICHNKNRSLQFRRQSDTLLETRSREKDYFNERNDGMYHSNNNEIFIRRRESDSIPPASNNGFPRTYQSARRHSDHRMDGGGPWGRNQHYMDGPTWEQRGKRYISERDDFYINNDFAPSSRRNPVYLKVARQQEVRCSPGRPMPSSINRTLDRNYFPDKYQKERRVHYDTRIRNDIEEPYLYKNTGEMFDYGRRNTVERRERKYNEGCRTYQNEANFDQRRNNYEWQSHNSRATAGAEGRHYDHQNGYGKGNIIKNRSNDFHLERPDYLRLELDDNVEERILFDANGNVVDISTQPTYNKNKLHIEAVERNSTMHEPLHCSNKKRIHGCDPMFYHRKALVDPDTSAFSVVEEGYVSRLKGGTDKKPKYMFTDERGATEPDEQIICYRKRMNSGRNGNDTDNIERRTRNGHDRQYNNAKSSSYEDARYRKLKRRSTEEPDPSSSKLESRNKRGVFDRSCYKRKSSEDTSQRKLKRLSQEPSTNSSKELRERSHRSSKMIREEKHERNRRDEDPDCCNCDTSRSRRPESPSTSKRKMNGNRERALANTLTNDRHHGGVGRSKDFDSSNTEESLDKSNASVAPRHEENHSKETSTSSNDLTYKREEYYSQSKMSDVSLVLVEDRSFGPSPRRLALAEQEEVSYVSRTTSYHGRRNSSDEQKLPNNNSNENAKDDYYSPRLSITTNDISTETEREDAAASRPKPERKMTGYGIENELLLACESSQNYSYENNRRCSQQCTHKGCSCKCRAVKKCRMCKCRSKSQGSGENVSPIFSNWLQQSKDFDNKAVQANSCKSICRQCESCKSEKVRENHNKNPCSCCRCAKIAKNDEPSPSRNCKCHCGSADKQRPIENRQNACCACPGTQHSREHKSHNWSYDSSLQQANCLTQLPVCYCYQQTMPISRGCGCNNM